MNSKKKYLLFSFFLIITIQVFLYVNNKEKSSFRYFNWTFQEISIGKLISVSFFSGLTISTILSNLITNYKKNNYENIEENYTPSDYEENIKPDLEMPPQRDIRDTQPTISVNYRVIKNNEGNNLEKDQNYSNNSYDKDDWDKDENEW